MTQALKSPDGSYQDNNVPRTSHNLAWRGRGSRSGSLRRVKGLSWTSEEGNNGDGADNSLDPLGRHLRSDDGAGTRGPSRGSTCRGRACSVPCTRARSGSCSGTCPLRDGPACASPGDIRSTIVLFVRSTDPHKEADADLQAQDRTSEERCWNQEDPGQAQEALSEKRKNASAGS